MLFLNLDLFQSIITAFSNITNLTLDIVVCKRLLLTKGILSIFNSITIVLFSELPKIVSVSYSIKDCVAEGRAR